MKVAMLYSNGDLKVENYEMPVAGEGEVLLKIKSAGICGSDKHRFIGMERMPRYPIILGHEFSGEIIGTGKGVTLVKAGDRVVGVPILPCHRCEECMKGNYAQCIDFKFVGLNYQGSFAEYIKLPERNVLKIDDRLSYDEGAFIEPSTMALHAMEAVGFRAGEDVAILGGGVIGLLLCKWAKLFGARRVFVYDIDDYMLEIAKKIGADEIINPSEEGYLEKTAGLTGGKGFGYVFETAGADFTFKLAFELAGNKSKVCYVGIPNHELLFKSGLFFNMYKKEFSLTGVLMSFSAPFPGREWHIALEYMNRGIFKIDDEFIYKRLPLDEIQKAQEMFMTPGQAKAKIMIQNL